MSPDQLFSLIKERNSYLCVGLDTDIEKIPPHLLKTDNPVLEFNKAIIDATRDLCVAYKPNIAFYEALGVEGWQILDDTINYIGDKHLIIADAKRGDIGNTSKLYAKAFFEKLNAGALTIAPYMGKDSVTPFLGFEGKYVILLGLTSNPGSDDFQQLDLTSGKKLFQEVIQTATTWAGPDQMMFVIGATHPEKFKEIRELAPDYFSSL
ncbi:MAG: orotidine-5'-phosphate decarboxylase [Saprospiraceae bacterium]